MSGAPSTGQLDTCNEAHRAPVQSEAAEFTTAIYCLPLYRRNVIPPHVSDAAIIAHYGEVTEMEQGVLMDAGAGLLPVIMSSIEQSVRDTSNKMAVEQNNMAATARS